MNSLTQQILYVQIGFLFFVFCSVYGYLCNRILVLIVVVVVVVVHDWCNKGRGMCYPVCGMVYIKEPLLLIGKSSLCGGSGFPFSL